MDPNSSERPLRPPPRVTVILPTYNRERYLAGAVGSVLGQTFGDFELLIVDDGSTDTTAALIGAVDDDRVRYFVTSHCGVSAAVNVGLRHARGEYIARLDSDDLFVPEALATLVAALAANPEIGVVWARGQLMNRDGCDKPRSRGWPEHFPGDLLRSLVYEDCTTSPAMLIRRACFERVGPYDETLASSEDWDMSLRLARHFRFQFVDQVVVRIREHDDSLTGRSQRAAFLEARTAPLNKLFLDPKLPPVVAAMKPIAYGNVHILRGRIFLSALDFADATREFTHAMRVSDRPIATAAAIGWWAVLFQVLDRSAAGRRAIAALQRFARALRARCQPAADAEELRGGRSSVGGGEAVSKLGEP